MRKLAIVVALSSTVLATPALARDGAWYVGGDFGAMLVEDMEFDVTSSSGVETTNAITADYDYGYDGALFVGYDLGSFRVEAEAAYKRAAFDRYDTTLNLPGANGGAGVRLDAGGGNATALSFMVNGMFDFGDDDGISGFVGGGVGVARVSFNNLRAFENVGPFVDDTDTRFAWQAVAGLRQAVSDNVDVTLRYRFFNADGLRLVGFNNNEMETRFRSHSILGGLTFNFGAPPPPPPPVVEVAPPPAPVYVPPAPVPPPPAPTCPNGSPVPASGTCVVGPFIVFFDWDRADITPQAASILDNAATAYQQTGQAQVVLAGHADRSGSTAYNDRLSQRRAEAVRQYLAGRGVPEGSTRTEAFGENRPLVETADGVREPQNRRVEITFGPGSGW